MAYYAHSKEGLPLAEWQTVREHAENVAALCVRFTEKWCSEEFAFDLGLLHDVGKYQPDFQRRIRGDPSLRVEHAFCGAIESRHYKLCGADYCIAGHHSGLPDVGTKVDREEEGTLCAKCKRKAQDYSVYRSELTLRPLRDKPFRFTPPQDQATFQKRFAFWIRMMFSALVDADNLDTEAFCQGARPPIPGDLARCREQLDQKLRSFAADTSVRRARRALLEQAMGRAGEEADLYLMNMPTGSGKTLASMAFALEQAVRRGLKRIIYVIPYTSIIEQNAGVFREIFGEDVVLEHHYNFDDKKIGEEGTREKLRRAAENWEAPVIVTTNVQFFESIYGNRPAEMRKLHNIAGSMLVFDEAHLFPEAFYQPCLEAVKFLVRDYGCRALFLTATMPDFSAWLKDFGCGELKTCELIRDTSVFPVFERCRIEDLSAVSVEKLLSLASEATSSLLVVNTRRAARMLYEKLGGEKYHLSTWMTKLDRDRVIRKVREALSQGRQFVLVSTSLIEAGVDLDFERVFRERAGLDNVLQTAGRCNREGRRDPASCRAYVFDFEEQEWGTRDPAMKTRQYFCLGEMQKRGASPEAVRAYFDRLFGYYQGEMKQHDFSGAVTALGFQFETYAEKFRLIDDNSLGVIVVDPEDEQEREILNSLALDSKKARRQLQAYAVSLRGWEADRLRAQGVLEERDGLIFLTNFNYYDRETGIRLRDDSDYIY